MRGRRRRPGRPRGRAGRLLRILRVLRGVRSARILADLVLRPAETRNCDEVEALRAEVHRLTEELHRGRGPGPEA